jgi:hypothetical protein
LRLRNFLLCRSRLRIERHSFLPKFDDGVVLSLLPSTFLIPLHVLPRWLLQCSFCNCPLLSVPRIHLLQ